MSFKSWTLILGLCLFSVKPAWAAAWPHSPDRKWNEAWESKYSDWVKNNLKTDWLQQKDFIFFNWNVDCAKFIYLARLSFSYQNNLEFAIRDKKNNLKIISSANSDWDAVPIGVDRVRAFARSILNQVNTSTLPQDSVLIPLNVEFVKPGVIVLADRLRAHSWMIAEIHPSGIPKLIYATLPGSAYLYESFVFPAAESAFPSAKLPSDSSAGLRRFRWPQDLLKISDEINYASHDQFDTRIVRYQTFFDDIQSRIKIRPKNSNEEFGYLLDDLCMKVRVRVNIIIDAGQALQSANKLDPARYEELYSTVGRDRDILFAISRVDTFFNQFKSQIQPDNQDRYQSLIAPKWTTDDECLVSWAKNRTEPLGIIRQRFLDGLISSRATDTFAERWGEIR